MVVGLGFVICENFSEKDLIEDLLGKYNRYARPVKDAKRAVQLRVKMMLLQVIDVVSRFFSKIYAMI